MHLATGWAQKNGPHSIETRAFIEIYHSLLDIITDKKPCIGIKIKL